MNLTPMNPDLQLPSGMNERAKQAHDIILTVLKRHDLLYTGGCKAFHNPSKWDERYGKNSILIVVYDGSAIGNAFSLDRYQYDLVDEMQNELGKVGMFVEECTTCYSAVYEIWQ